MSASPPRKHCPNCDHRLAPWDKFCSQCGQDTLNHPPSLWEFVHEFVQHYIAFEGKLWKSLWALLLRPGFLSAEYVAGRKQRYVLPLRLILTLGLVFFIVAKMAWGDADTQLVTVDEPTAQVAGPAASAAERRRDAKVIDTGDTSWTDYAPKFLIEASERFKERNKADPKAENRRMLARALSLAPYAVLCSLPFYAGLLVLVYWGRRMTFGAHFVFAMHLHAAWYLMLALCAIPSGWVTAAMVFWINLYPLLALKRFYGGGWWGTLLRGAVVGALHLMLGMAGAVLVIAIGALSV